MCTILFAYRNHPRYELVVASNRDEAYDRPSASARFWEDDPRLLAGRDELQGGTWLGVSKNGRFAALTNHRHGMTETPAKRSRGELVATFLASNDSSPSYVKKVQARKNDYNGFHLLVYDRRDLFYYSATEDETKRLERGVYGLSNAALGVSWPKVEKGKRRLEKILAEHPAELPDEELFKLLADNERPSDAELPDTGIGLEKERLVSSLFIDGSEYGTRASTVLTIDQNGRVEFTERTFRNGLPIGDARFSFQIETR